MATGAMLKRLGHVVAASVTSGEAALEAFRRQHPDLVLMDIRLDGELDGIETARAIRSQSQVPVVFVSAYVDDQTRGRAAETQPYAFMPKPSTNTNSMRCSPSCWEPVPLDRPGLRGLRP